MFMLNKLLFEFDDKTINIGTKINYERILVYHSNILQRKFYGLLYLYILY